MTIEFGAKTLTKCGGKVLPHDTLWAWNAQNIAVSGDDALPKFFVRGYDDTAGVGLLTCREPVTVSVAGAGVSAPRWHGMTRWTPPTYDSLSYTLVLTKSPAAGGGTYAEDITIIPGRADCRTLAELRSTFHDFASNLRGVSVFLQESNAYGTLHIDRPGTVTRLMDTDGTTVLTDWSQASKAKGADEILEIALWGAPDTSVGGVDTLNAASRITKITGPGTCTVTVAAGDTGDLTITRGALTKSTHNALGAWPYDHAIGVIKSVGALTGVNASHWQCAAGFLPRPSSAGDSADLSGGPYTIGVPLVGTRGSATRQVTINIVANAYTICSNADLALVSEGSGIDLRGKTVLVGEHCGESVREAAFTRVRGFNGKNGTGTGSPTANQALTEADRCIFRYADATRRPEFGHLSWIGARWTTIQGLRQMNYNRPSVGTTGNKSITWGNHLAIGSLDIWQSPTDVKVEDHIVRGQIDRRSLWAQAYNFTAPNCELTDPDYRNVVNGIMAGTQAAQSLQARRVRIGGFTSNALFISTPGVNFLLDEYILYNAIQNEDDIGDHVDHIQLGSTNESTYTGARIRRGFIMYGDPPVDSDGFYIGNPFGQTGFCNDMTYNSTGTGPALGTGASAPKLVPGTSVDITFENNVFECYLRQGMWFAEIVGQGKALFNTIWARPTNPPERHRIQIPFTDILNAEIFSASAAEVANPSNTYQMDLEWRQNMAPQIFEPGDFGGTHIMEHNNVTGRVAPEDDFMVATPITDWHNSTFDELYAACVAFCTPVEGGLAAITDSPGVGKYYGAYFPDGTLNTGEVFNAPPVTSVTTSLSASQIPSNGSVVVTYTLDAAAVAPVVITPSKATLTGTFDDATVTIGIGESIGTTIFRPTAAGTGTIGGADDAGLTGPNSIALEVINAGTLVFEFPHQSLINTENELLISADGPVGSDVTITLTPLANVAMSTLTPVIPAGSSQVAVDVIISRAGTYTISGTDNGGFGGPSDLIVKVLRGKKALVKV